jgi:hypothetical protein
MVAYPNLPLLKGALTQKSKSGGLFPDFRAPALKVLSEHHQRLIVPDDVQHSLVIGAWTAQDRNQGTDRDHYDLAIFAYASNGDCLSIQAEFLSCKHKNVTAYPLNQVSASYLQPCSFL